MYKPSERSANFGTYLNSRKSLRVMVLGKYGGLNSLLYWNKRAQTLHRFGGGNGSELEQLDCNVGSIPAWSTFAKRD